MSWNIYITEIKLLDPAFDFDGSRFTYSNGTNPDPAPTSMGSVSENVGSMDFFLVSSLAQIAHV